MTIKFIAQISKDIFQDSQGYQAQGQRPNPASTDDNREAVGRSYSAQRLILKIRIVLIGQEIFLPVHKEPYPERRYILNADRSAFAML